MDLKDQKETSREVTMTGCVFINYQAGKYKRIEDLPTWIERIRTGVYKEPVEAYRDYKAKGLDNLAQNIKNSIEAHLSAGVCPNGRKKDDPITPRSTVYMVDYDCYDKEWVSANKESMKQVKWIAASHDSIGGGLRLYIVLPVVDAKYFTIWIRVALKRLDAMVGQPHDPHCDHLTRLSVASYDPDAWIRPAEECEFFPYTEEEYQRIQQQTAAVDRQLTFLPAGDEGELAEVNFTQERNFTAEQILKKMQEYMAMSPYERGNHHDSLIMGGAMARCEGLTTADLSEMAQLIRQHYPAPGYDFKEILRNLLYGYGHPSYYQRIRYRNRYEQFGNQEEDLDDFVSNAEIIENNCPYFGKEVLDNLPALITSLLLGLTKRQRDILIASSMAALSSVMANVTCHYRGKSYSANLAFCVVAPAGSGKGVCLEAQRLIQPIQDEYDAAYNTSLQAYRKEKHRWNIEKERAAREGKYETLLKEPVEPKQIDFLNSDIISLSRFIEEQHNSPHGMIMFISELAEYNRIEQADYGRLTATYRKVMMNEPVSMNFKTCGMVRVPKPKASYVFAGTDDDFIKFIHNVENGTLSRMAILTGASDIKWATLEEDLHNLEIEKELNQRFEKAGQTVLELFHYLIEHPTDVYFDPAMYDELNSFFDYATQKLVWVGREELASLVNRGAILCLRLGAILTCLRKFENKSTEREIPVCREDFNVALSMTQVFLRHAAQYSTILPSSSHRSESMKPFDSTELIFDKLPEQFETKEALQVFAGFSIGRTAAFRCMKHWQEEGRVTTLVKGKHSKVKTGNQQNDQPAEQQLTDPVA